MPSAIRALVHYYWAQLLTRVHLDRLALEQLRVAIDADPGCRRAWRSYAFMLAGANRPDEAIAASLRALELDGEDAITRFNLGFMLHAQGRIDEAIPQFEQSVRLMPKNDRAWYGLGLCLQQLGDYAAAAAPLQEAARLQYFNPHAGYHLALGWHRLGEREKFAAELERVRGFDPEMANRIETESARP